GNIIAPKDVSKQLGTDILRLWVASVDYQGDVRISQDILKQTSESYRKIRNTIRFMLGSLNDFEPSVNRVAEENLEEADKYMYYYGSVSQAIHNYIANELSAFYLDFAKDILYVEHRQHPRRRSMQTVYYDTVVTLVQLLSPIIPHTTEEIWEHIPQTTAKYA